MTGLSFRWQGWECLHQNTLKPEAEWGQLAGSGSQADTVNMCGSAPATLWPVFPVIVCMRWLDLL